VPTYAYLSHVNIYKIDTYNLTVGASTKGDYSVQIFNF